MLKILIVEDEFISRTLLMEMMAAYGICHVAVDGREAMEVLHRSFDHGEHYDLICLDIMMPEMNGQEVLTEIRTMERQRDLSGRQATKVIMTTALADSQNIMKAFTEGHCEAYLTKPIDRSKLIATLRDLNLIT
jgi:two-component system, chemotaxis family, chemotaxis protein CheY